ncbi:unnamed protein product [Allacma fusca]|uniref:Calcium release-activated calcium channel protein 1 n=1 Tax=Allacma fusca TaxID=39272 RepID=A0A8J2NTH8_9HEXA|nr:unnamed protein product [Allacma fusca]
MDPGTRMSTLETGERRDSIRVPDDDEDRLTTGGDMDSDNEPDYLVRRRLHLSRAKLRGVTEMAALMAGFSVVATVELQIRKCTSPILLTSFAVTTALLVTTTMLSIMIATCILPHLEAVAKLDSIHLMKESPHEALIKYIDLSWVLANTFSILLFIVDVILLCWIKFEDLVVCIAFTSIMIPVLILLIIFSLIFYRQSVQHQYDDRRRKCDELEILNELLNNRSTSNNNSRVPSFNTLQV